MSVVVVVVVVVSDLIVTWPMSSHLGGN